MPDFLFFKELDFHQNGGVSCLLAKANRRGNASNAAKSYG